MCDKYFHFGKVNYVAKAVKALGGDIESFADRSEAIKFIISKMNELQKRNQVDIIQTGMDYTTYPSMSEKFSNIDISSANEKDIDDYLSFHLQVDKSDYFGGFNKTSTPDLFDVYFKSKKMKKEFENEVDNASSLYAILFSGDGSSFYKNNQKDFQKFFSLEFFQYFRPSDLKAFIGFADGLSDFENVHEVIDEESEKKNCENFKKLGDILRCIEEEDNVAFLEKSNMWSFECNPENVLPDEGEDGYSSDIPATTGMKRSAEITPDQDQKRMKAMLSNAEKESPEIRNGKLGESLASVIEEEASSSNSVESKSSEKSKIKSKGSTKSSEKKADESDDEFPIVSEFVTEKKVEKPKKPTIILKNMKSSSALSKQLDNSNFAFNAYVGKPVAQKRLENGSISFKVTIALRDINESKPLSSGIFLIHPGVLGCAFRLCWCASEADEHQIKIGSCNSYTWAVCKAFTKIVTLRATPSVNGNQEMSYKGGRKPNGQHYMNEIKAVCGVYEFTAVGKSAAKNEIEKLHEELTEILHSDQFFRVYKMAAYWFFHCPNLDVSAVYGQLLNSANEDQFIHDTAVQATSDKYGSASYNFTSNARPRKVMLHWIVDDEDKVLQQGIKNYKVNLYENVPLDEIFLNRDITGFIGQLMGLYNEKFSNVVFGDSQSADKSFLQSM